MMPRRAAARRARCSIALALAMSACANETIRPEIPREVTGQRINPFELHEECVQMAPGDWLVYRFTAQRPVAFNIHYHEGKSVIMPVSRDDATADDGTFRPLVAQDYCLMWEAGREGAIIEYRILLNRGRR
jgi:hypothetical protein